MQKEINETPEPELLPPQQSDAEQIPTLLALVKNYTNRPDLLIAELEKHDEGFIKRMNANAEAHAKKLRDGKYAFGRNQAYVALIVSVIGALSAIGLMFLMVVKEAGFWPLIAGIGFYAVTQGGTFGFHTIIEGVASFFERRKKPTSEDEE